MFLENHHTAAHPVGQHSYGFLENISLSTRDARIHTNTHTHTRTQKIKSNLFSEKKGRLNIIVTINIVFCSVLSHSQADIYRRFGRTCCLRFQGRSLPKIRRQQIAPKRQKISTNLYSITSRKTVPFTVT